MSRIYCFDSRTFIMKVLFGKINLLAQGMNVLMEERIIGGSRLSRSKNVHYLLLRKIFRIEIKKL